MEALAKVHTGCYEHGGKLHEGRNSDVATFWGHSCLTHERGPVTEVGVALIIASTCVVALHVMFVPHPGGPVGDGPPSGGKPLIDVYSTRESIMGSIVKLCQTPHNQHEART